MHKIQMRKMGGSLGTTFPKEMTERMGLCEGDTLYLVEVDGEYRLTPYDPKFENVMEAYEHLSKRYRNTLRELAK
jgi:putative addiction module antidote